MKRNMNLIIASLLLSFEVASPLVFAEDSFRAPVPSKCATEPDGVCASGGSPCKTPKGPGVCATSAVGCKCVKQTELFPFLDEKEVQRAVELWLEKQQ